MTQLTLPASAKINLFLHIVGRRSDGYHQLQTAFQFLEWADSLHFQLRDDREIQLTHTGNAVDIPVEQNIIWRAAKRLQACTGVKQGANIQLEKRIPIGAGLGGGSSNAATTLHGLNHLWRCQLSSQTLEKMGAELGADVPVFVRGHASWAEGIGEQLTAIHPAEQVCLVIVPNCQVNTRWAFAHPDLPRNTPSITLANFLTGACATTNDFAAIIAKEYPEVAMASTWLAQYASPRLTGSGSAVFGFFLDWRSANATLSTLPPTFSAFITTTTNLSPLQKELDKMARRSL